MANMTLQELRDQIASLEGDDSRRKAWVAVLDAHLAGMGEPVAKVAKNESGQIYIEFRHKKSIASFIGAEFYTAPPINLAAVREVIAELRESADGPGTTFVTDDDLLWYANKLEAAIGDKT